ncbi:fructose-1,6-bisphosphatase II [Mariprofundus micogutta]|uniref:Fructose-1,6-bisphosphatase n=1 Tax=Mariprofundus micogutta TaxID=1921010 RepID=A0A1L8CJU5_9PROT|nr:class II fructose-bisphosphatase [Mariprofundus micogutta]GAV19155.1 fructose-1,6-bisphosphatase II [Mariprofundus micogutta]
MSSVCDLKIDLVEVCEAAARACAPFVGSGQKDEGDGLAVDAMRERINQVKMKGVVVIGEGAKDEAPALYDDEPVGTGEGVGVDIAVDPIEGTNLFAKDMPGSIVTLAAAPAGSMYRPGSCFYMDKQVYPKAARGRIDPEAPVADRLNALAKALGKDIKEIRVFILDKPRHKEMIQEVYACGAKVRLATDGDVNGAIQAVLNMGSDALFGIGGTPEGIVTACAARAMGAEMFGRMAPQKDFEIKLCEEEGIDTKRIITRDELITSDDCMFIATGLTSGAYCHHVKMGADADGRYMTTDTVVLSGSVGNIRRVQTTLHV